MRRIVEGETKVSKLTKLSANLQDEQAENLRQMLIAMTGDIRIIIVKLADRLHNMRTLGSMKPEKQQRIARETLEIFAPLAHRLGIGQIKWELEDLSFKYLDPDAYSYLQTRLRTRQEEREAHILQAIEQLRTELADDIELSEWVEEEDIAGRSKHLWSIHNKMQKEGKALEQIFDLLAIRLILTPKPVNAPEGRQKDRAEEAREKRVCYHSLGIVHSMWSPIPGRFKDYIAVPKPNGYQSLHTTVISQGGQPIEVQIRSRRMHMVAEFGVAAHWMYKQGSALAQKEREDWLSQMRQLQQDFTDASDFVDAVKNDILGGRVFVFTPRGDTVSLPQGATPVDFAYHIHSRIGDTTIGARVNSSIVSLSHKLKNGDMVEIVTNKSSTPSRDWLNFATTRSARSKIRHHFRILERGEALQNGHDVLEKYLRKRQLPVRQLMRTKILEDVSSKLAGSRNPDDLYLAIHAGKLTPGAVARALAPQLEQEQRPVRAPDAAPGRTRRRVRGGIFHRHQAGALLLSDSRRSGHGLPHAGPGRHGAPNRLPQHGAAPQVRAGALRGRFVESGAARQHHRGPRRGGRRPQRPAERRAEFAGGPQAQPHEGGRGRRRRQRGAHRPAAGRRGPGRADGPGQPAAGYRQRDRRAAGGPGQQKRAESLRRR